MRGFGQLKIQRAQRNRSIHSGERIFNAELLYIGNEGFPQICHGLFFGYALTVRGDVGNPGGETTQFSIRNQLNR